MWQRLQPSPVAPRRDQETGQYAREYTDAEFRTAVEQTTLSTTQDIADAVGCSYDLAYRRLLELEKEDVVAKKTVGGAFVWTA